MYYVDEDNNVYLKSGIDFRVKKGLQTLEGLTLATQEQVDDILNPTKTDDELFAEEMDALNAEYDKNMTILANKYNIAVARDGSQETAKVESARAEISTLDAQYESDKLAIINKYYGA